MAARIIEFCDAVKAAIDTAWPVVSRANPEDAVTREYAPDVGLSVDQADTLIAGRQVYVFPTEYSAPEMLDRDAQIGKLSCSVLCVERYTATAGSPPKSWLDDRIEFVQDKIFRVLNNPLALLADTLRPDPETPGVVEIVYDLETLIQHRAFWSLATFTYQEPQEY